MGATLHCSAQASHCGDFSCCGARALGTWGSVVVARRLSSCGSQAQQLWRTGLVALQHVGSSRTRAQTHVPCIGRGQFVTTAPPGKPLPIFNTGLPFFFLIDLEFYIHPSISPSLIICVASIFHSELAFTLLMISFDEWKFLILMCYLQYFLKVSHVWAKLETGLRTTALADGRPEVELSQAARFVQTQLCTEGIKTDHL